jgi:hypothetical protein
MNMDAANTPPANADILKTILSPCCYLVFFAVRRLPETTAARGLSRAGAGLRKGVSDYHLVQGRRGKLWVIMNIRLTIAIKAHRRV